MFTVIDGSYQSEAYENLMDAKDDARECVALETWSGDTWVQTEDGTVLYRIYVDESRGGKVMESATVPGVATGTGTYAGKVYA